MLANNTENPCITGPLCEKPLVTSGFPSQRASIEEGFFSLPQAWTHSPSHRAKTSTNSSSSPLNDYDLYKSRSRSSSSKVSDSSDLRDDSGSDDLSQHDVNGAVDFDLHKFAVRTKIFITMINAPVTSEFLSKRASNTQFDIFLDVSLNKPLVKQFSCW